MSSPSCGVWSLLLLCQAITMRDHGLSLQEYGEKLKQGMTLSDYQDYMADWVSRLAERGDGATPAKSLLEYFGMPFSVHTEPWAKFCPEILKEIDIPRYFPLDYLSTSHCLQNKIRAAMPEAFIAPGGSAAYPTHMHPFSTSVWLQLLHGQKR